MKNCAAARVREQIVSILESWGMDREIVRLLEKLRGICERSGVAFIL